MKKGGKKFNPEQIKEIIKLIEEGWNNTKIAKKMNCDISSIWYWRKEKLPKVRIIDEEDEDFKENFKEPKRGRSYKWYLRQSEIRRIKKQESCEHKFWIKKCSVCKKIMETQ